MDPKTLTIQEIRALLAICQAADPMHVFIPGIGRKLEAAQEALLKQQADLVPAKTTVVEEKKP